MLTHGDVTFHPESCVAAYGDRDVKLNPKEYALLELFLRYPRHVLSYDAIIDQLWQGESIPTYSGIRTHIKRLRKAFKVAGYPDEIVENVHGLGYRLKQVSPQANNVVHPSVAVLERFFKAKAIEYLVLDEGQLIGYLSPNAIHYSDYPAEVQVGAAIKDGFPEFVGLETTLEDVRTQQLSSFELKGIGREHNPYRPEYINLYAIADHDSQTSQRLFIFFEDASETMTARQRLVQRANETILLLERLQS